MSIKDLRDINWEAVTVDDLVKAPGVQQLMPYNI